jgi:dTDP-4-amino-4,6-dideoxygalactose transaminase
MPSELKEIKVLIPSVPKADCILPYLKEIDSTRIYSNFGPLNAELIARLSSYIGIGTQNIATCANATLAIQGLIASNPIKSHDWELPVWTFTATPAAAVNSGKNLEFVDSNVHWRADFDSRRSKGHSLIDIAPFGDLIETMPVVKCKSLIVDAAPCFDSVKKIDLHDDYPVAVVVSLHATKLLPAGEGAFVFSNSTEWISTFKSWTNFGMDGDRVSQFIGTNAKLSEYGAAVALASLDLWPSTRIKFLELSKKALTTSHKYGFLTSPAMEKGLVTPYWILRLEDKKQKSHLINLLNNNNIEWRDWWKEGIHKMPAYANFIKRDFPQTDLLSSVTIGLPMHSELTEIDLMRISNLIKSL